ncbi:unnamed protein product [Heligmosomoides polygyrus]|uniref:Uncharacterized protein n=1 Tax=Heligmosomoides polygyrus TaxID=6339 RepID=A0A183FP78_HELPZ|nr:unnamed protein product [Heligmosomoides polygyrus]
MNAVPILSLQCYPVGRVVVNQKSFCPLVLASSATSPAPKAVPKARRLDVYMMLKKLPKDDILRQEQRGDDRDQP